MDLDRPTGGPYIGGQDDSWSVRRQNPPVLFSFFDGPLDFPAGFAGFDGLAPVVQLLALREPKLDLRVSALGEVDAEGDQGEPFLLGLAQQLMDLGFVKQELPDSRGIMVHDVP